MISLLIALAIQQAPAEPMSLDNTAAVCRIAVERKRAGDATWLQRELRARPKFGPRERDMLFLICAGYALAVADADAQARR
jgi:hypothetical protein